MIQQRINGYLGLARRGNRLALGETALYHCRLGKARLLIIAGDASDNTRNKAIKVANDNHVPYQLYATKAELGVLLGKGSVALLGLLDKGLSQRVIHEMEDEHYGQ